MGVSLHQARSLSRKLTESARQSLFAAQSLRQVDRGQACAVISPFPSAQTQG